MSPLERELTAKLAQAALDLESAERRAQPGATAHLVKERDEAIARAAEGDRLVQSHIDRLREVTYTYSPARFTAPPSWTGADTCVDYLVAEIMDARSARTVATLELDRWRASMAESVATITRLRAENADRERDQGALLREREERDATLERIEKALGSRCTGDLAAGVERLVAESRAYMQTAVQRDDAYRAMHAARAEAAAHLAALRDLCERADVGEPWTAARAARAYLASIDGNPSNSSNSPAEYDSGDPRDVLAAALAHECGDPSAEARYREMSIPRLASIAAARLVDAVAARGVPAAEAAPDEIACIHPGGPCPREASEPRCTTRCLDGAAPVHHADGSECPGVSCERGIHPALRRPAAPGERPHAAGDRWEHAARGLFASVTSAWRNNVDGGWVIALDGGYTNYVSWFERDGWRRLPPAPAAPSAYAPEPEDADAI